MFLLRKLVGTIFLFLLTETVFGQSVTYSALFDNSNFDRTIVDLTSRPIGVIEGSAGTSPNGAVTYTLPIKVPAGTNGMTPGISLVYNSQAGNGIVGLGWNITGLSSITRAGKDFYHDGKTTAVTYTNDDVFMLDGIRLALKSGSYGSNLATYGLEIESYAVTTSYGTVGGGPQYFNVVSKDGTIMQYGNSEDSRIKSDDNIKVMMWRLNKIRDVNGNTIWFSYDNTDRDSRIKEIKYTSNDITGLAAYFVMKFNYQLRDDKNTFYDGGYSMNLNNLLTSIDINEISTSEKFRTYSFWYGKKGSQSYLKLVSLYNANGDNLNDTRFKYGDETTGISLVESNIELPTHPGHPTTGYGYDYADAINSGDFDGDGIKEIYVNSIRTQIPYSNPVGIPESDISFKVYKSGGYGSSTYSSYNLASYKMYHTMRSVPSTVGTANKMLLPYDYNGDGKDDIFAVKINGSELDKRTIYYSNSGSSLSFTSNEIDPIVNPAPFSTGKNITSNDNLHGDFDGDKSMDFITIIKDGSGSNLATISFPQHGWYNMPITTSSAPYSPSAAQANLLTIPDFVFVIDMNGDGKSELLTYSKGSQTINVYAVTLRLYGKYSIDLVSSLTSIDCDQLIPGDFNGDGKSDLVYYKKSSGVSAVRLLYSNGNNFWSDITSVIYAPECSMGAGDQLYVADFNGDNKSDIVAFRRDCNSYYLTRSYFNVYYSKGIGHFDYESIELSDVPDNTVSSLIADVNGDGLSDFIYKSVSSRKLKIISFNNRMKSMLLEKINDGLNNTTVNYEPLSKGTGTGAGDFYAKGSGESYPVNNVQFPIYVATSITVPNGIGGTKITNFKYGDLRVHRLGRGVLGFSTITSIDPLNDLRSESQYRTNGYFIPFLKRQKVFINSSAVQMSESVYDYSFSPVSLHCFKQELISEETHDFFKGTYSILNNTFDAYGNITLSTITTTGGETFTSSVSSTYISTSGSTIPNKQSEVISTSQRGSASPLGTRTTYTYDTYGRPLSIGQHTVPYSVLDFTSQDFVYDTYGNVTTSTHKGYGIPSSKWPVTRFEYDAKGRFAIKEINSHGDEKLSTIHKFWGTPLSVTDFNGLTATYTYNNWGKPATTNIPTSLSTSYSVNYSEGWDIGTNQFYYTLVQDPSAPDVKIWYDCFGRVRKIQEETFGGVWTTANTTYDAKGNIATSTNNYLSTETPVINTNSYDYLNRISSSTNLFGTTSYAYSMGSGLETTTVTFPDGKVKKSTVDAIGKVIKSTNGIAGTVHYTYDSRGNEISNDLGTETMAYHNLIRKEYDVAGRLKKLIDQDAGTTTYTYNSFGQLLQEVDPKSKSTTIEYDNWGRISRKNVDGTSYLTTYTYYDRTKSYELETLNVTGVDGTVIDHYDYELGKGVVQHIKTINGVIIEKTFGYDSYNRLNTTENHNSNFKTKKYFDANGFLTKIATNFTSTPSLEKTLYQVISMNGNGQVKSFKRADGLTATNTYYNGIITNYGTPGIQDLSMSHNYANGNLLSRTDNITQTHEIFEYDAIDRLTKASASKTGVYGMMHLSLEMSYDGRFWGSFGRISSKSDVGTYEYGGFPRNAVKSVSDPLNIVSHETQDVVYNLFHKTQKITEKIGVGNYEEKFIYDSYENRAYSQQSQDLAPAAPVTVVRKRWYAGDFEIEEKISGASTAIRKLHYINSNAGLVGIVVEEGGSYHYNSVYTDHLGSIVTLTDDGGTVIAKQSYDAWGRERNPDTWGYTATYTPGGTTPTPPDWLYRGYTGHEMLPEYGFINMNGRLYDPVNGRMARPDIYIQDPSNSQCYNRYSYCWNNPLKYTDPTGDYALVDDILAAFIGGTINWATNGFKLNGEGLKYFGVGAAGGFVSLYATPIAGAALVGAGNAAIGSYSQTGRIDAGAVIKGAVVSGIMGAATMGIGNAVAPTLGSTFANISSPVLRNSLTQGALGMGLGAGSAFVMGGDGDAILNGAMWGLGTGLATGAMTGFRSAKRDNVSPWTGKSKETALVPYYPPNDGASGDWKVDMTKPGEMYDRYGSLKGSYFSPAGTPIDMRSLPHNTNTENYMSIEVIKSFPVMKSTIAPAFGKMGQGIQYKAPVNIEFLHRNGYIKIK